MKRKLVFLFILFTFVIGAAAFCGCAAQHKAPDAKLEHVTVIPVPPDPVEVAKNEYDTAKTRTGEAEKAVTAAKAYAEERRIAFAAALKQKAAAMADQFQKLAAQQKLYEQEAAALEGTASPTSTPETNVVFTYNGGDKGDVDSATPLPQGWEITIKNSVLTLKINGTSAFKPAKLTKGTEYQVNVVGVTPVK